MEKLVSPDSDGQALKRPLILELDSESGFHKGTAEIEENGKFHYRYVQGAHYQHKQKNTFTVLHHEHDWEKNEVGARPSRSFEVGDDSPQEQTVTDVYRIGVFSLGKIF